MNQLPPVKKLRMMLLQNSSNESLTLFGVSDEIIRQSPRYKKLKDDGWIIIDIYDVKGNS
ncbi:MAG: hypothetical protein AB1349_07900 [Elusimicrobiota bacterium]